MDSNQISSEKLPDAASRSIRRHTLYAAAGTLIPIPFIEVVTNTSMQIHMIAQLCDIYGVRFSEHAVKASLATFVGVVVPSGSIGASVHTLARAVPVVGPVLGLTTAPVLAGAMTWAIGRVFAWHFERGGSLDDFRAEDAIARFRKEFAEGKRRVSQFASGNATRQGI